MEDLVLSQTPCIAQVIRTPAQEDVSCMVQVIRTPAQEDVWCMVLLVGVKLEMCVCVCFRYCGHVRDVTLRSCCINETSDLLRRRRVSVL